MRKQRLHNQQSFKRDDIGIYVRSSYEANIARIFKYLEVPYQYEPETLKFPYDRGNNKYTPDFYLPERELYIEVKGYMDNDSKIKLKRFNKFYPDKKLWILSAKIYKNIEIEFSKLIHFWEYSSPSAIKKSKTELKCFNEYQELFFELIESSQKEELEKLYARKSNPT